MVRDGSVISLECTSIVEPRDVAAPQQLHALVHLPAMVPSSKDRVFDPGKKAWHLPLSERKLWVDRASLDWKGKRPWPHLEGGSQAV